jgi:hypothetical protein
MIALSSFVRFHAARSPERAALAYAGERRAGSRRAASGRAAWSRC